MDYFSVVILVIVILTFISDRNVKSIDRIKKEKMDIDLIYEINEIKSKLEIVMLDTKKMKYDNIYRIIKNSKNNYILVQNDKLDLNSNDINTIMANYIASNKKASGFNLLYEYQDKKWSLKRIYIDIINYLNIFNKRDLTTYGVLLLTKNDVFENERKFKNELIPYTPTEFTCIKYTKSQISTNNLKRIYLDKLNEANVSIIIKILLLIISGTIITTNLIYSILNVNNNINGLIISGVIYYCYSYIIRYIYKPIGRRRMIASYIFPVYFASYIIVGTFSLISKVIKKVHAS